MSRQDESAEGNVPLQYAPDLSTSLALATPIAGASDTPPGWGVTPPADPTPGPVGRHRAVQTPERASREDERNAA